MDRTRFEQVLARRASRRALIGIGAAGVAALSLPGRPTRLLAGQATPLASPAATPAGAAGPFALGVASGDPLPDGVVLWTRLAPDPLAPFGGMEGQPAVEVRWEVTEDESFGRLVAQGTTTATPELAHSVHVDATGLAPGREYVYRFLAAGEASPVGRTKTAPPPDAALDRLRFAFASCSHYEHGYFAPYRHLAAEDLDLVLHLGDYIYEYPAGEEFLPSGGPPVRLHLGGETVTLADYRLRHALYKTDPDLQSAHAAFPWVVTWDDHEVENNYADSRSENGDPGEDFLVRRADAYQAYYEHLPLRPASLPQGPAMQLYRRLAFGTLLDIAMLDTRQYRSDHPCGDDIQVRCAAGLDPNATMTGPEQERWLLAGLDASSTRWHAIGQQVMMAQLDTRPGPAETFVSDLWDGYPAARNRILGHLLHAGTPNAVVLTGDIHANWVNDLKADFLDPASATVATEFVTTSITADNPVGAQLPFLLPDNPHIKHVDALHGYTRCEVTADRWLTELRTVEHVASPDVPIATSAAFVVENGRPGAVPA